ncbi:hypothetical protein ACE01N_13335 [Saccharicrinis sp. FJH2]|uniref:hypothetical protein n=1 Tax=Saccharicrinis sp. FJH65 TaxID=3344659 RepID=UPI0035F4532B
MNQNITLIYDQQANVFINKIVGKVDLNHILDTWQNALESMNIPGNFKGFIIDCEFGHFDFSLKHFEKMVMIYRAHVSKLRNKKVAIVSNDPHDVVFSTLLEFANKYNTKTFSTHEAALHWMHA